MLGTMDLVLLIQVLVQIEKSQLSLPIAMVEQCGVSLHSLTGVNPLGRTDDDAMSQSLKCAGSNPAGGTSLFVYS